MGLGNPRVELGPLMVFASFGILGFSWKTALERRCLLFCWGMELRGGRSGRSRDGDVEEVGGSFCHAMSVWDRQQWWGWDQQDKSTDVGTEAPSH